MRETYSKLTKIQSLIQKIQAQFCMWIKIYEVKSTPKIEFLSCRVRFRLFLLSTSVNFRITTTQESFRRIKTFVSTN